MEKITIGERWKIAHKLGGCLGAGKLNWMGDYYYVNRGTTVEKREQFSIFFSKMSQVKKAHKLLGAYQTMISSTPTHINVYFKYSITIKL